MTKLRIWISEKVSRWDTDCILVGTIFLHYDRKQHRLVLSRDIAGVSWVSDKSKKPCSS